MPDPGLNFRDAFAGTTNDAYGITNALVRINFAYSGWENCFNVVAEIKVSECSCSPHPPLDPSF